jgi:arylformamidase
MKTVPSGWRPAIHSAIGFVVLLIIVQRASTQSPAKKEKIQDVRDITYFEVENDPDAYRHQLDVYRPAGKGPYPVLVFLHGGAWMLASKDDICGIYGYATIGRCLAERGLVVVVPNYRLSPAVRHPEHIKDAARAFAWTRKNIAKHGGDAQKIFVGGHSAGGHLAALLATDETYLKQVGHAAKDIRGVIGVSGVYRVDEFDLDLLFADPAGNLRGKLNVRPLALVFGSDSRVVKQASPLTHVRRGLPPFLLLYGGWDYPPMRRMARDFAAALEEKECDVTVKPLPWRTHETIVFDILRLTADGGMTDTVVDFIDRHTKP